jgi:predicted transcriptional regulator/transcriptional regulator with XRE-family HTH domain
MGKPQIGRTVRRLRQTAGLTQNALALQLGISASYLNLIEHDQRAVTATLLIKLAQALGVELADLSGLSERRTEVQLREAFGDRRLGVAEVPEEEVAALVAGSPAAAEATLALYRAWRVAQEDAAGIALPSGRRILLPVEEVRDVFDANANHFPALEEASERLAAVLGVIPSEMNHALAVRLRQHHGLQVSVGPLDGALRRYDPDARTLVLSEQSPRESRGFHMAFQLALLEEGEAVDHLVTKLAPTSPEAAGLLRLGLLNYLAAAVLMPYAPFAGKAMALRHDIDALAAHFGVSFEQAAQRLSSLQRPGSRGIPFFFTVTDPAGNVGKRFAGAGFPFARYGASCPRWVVHTAFATPGQLQVQVARLPDGATFLTIARAVIGRAAHWGDVPPTHTVAIGCPIVHAADIVYADGMDLERSAVGIGASCRLCDRPDCRSRAHPPLLHRLAFDPLTTGTSRFRFE